MAHILDAARAVSPNWRDKLPPVFSRRCPPAMPQFAANLTLMYTELPFLERFAAAAQDGFTAVEFQ